MRRMNRGKTYLLHDGVDLPYRLGRRSYRGHDAGRIVYRWHRTELRASVYGALSLMTLDSARLLALLGRSLEPVACGLMPADHVRCSARKLWPGARYCSMLRCALGLSYG